MNKRIAILCVLAILASAGAPAFASSPNKKVSLDCSAGAGNEITVTATLTLCAGFDGTNCTGQTFDCAALSCDSSGLSAPVSASETCRPGFRSEGFFVSASWNDNGIGSSFDYPPRVVQAHGFTVQVIGDMQPDFGELRFR